MIIPQNKITEIMETIGERMVSEAVQKAPVDLGDLRRHINYRLEGNTLVFFCDVPYAENMEYGVKPGMPVDEENIKDWGRRHGIAEKNLDALVKSISKRGIKVGTVQNPKHVTSLGRNSYRPFMRPAMHKIATQDVFFIIKEALAK